MSHIVKQCFSTTAESNHYFIPNNENKKDGILLNITNPQSSECYFITINCEDYRYSSTDFWHYFDKSDVILVSCGGTAYLVGLFPNSTPNSTQIGILPVRDYKIQSDIVLLSSYNALAKIQDGSLLWIKDNLSIDGMKIDSVDMSKQLINLKINTIEGDLQDLILNLESGLIIT